MLAFISAVAVFHLFLLVFHLSLSFSIHFGAPTPTSMYSPIGISTISSLRENRYVGARTRFSGLENSAYGTTGKSESRVFTSSPQESVWAYVNAQSSATINILIIYYNIKLSVV